MARSITRNFVYNIIKAGINTVFPLIIFPYVNHTLTPEYVGRIDVGSAFVGYFTLLATLGVEVYAVRECSAVRGDRKKLEKVSSQILSINICTMLLSFALMFAVLFMFSRLSSYVTVILILSLNTFFTIIGTTWLNNAMEDFGFVTVTTLVLQVISLAAIFIFVRSPEDYIKRAVIAVFPVVILNTMNIFYRRRFCKVGLVRDMDFRAHFASIVMLFGMLLSQTVFNNSDIIMLGIIRNDYEAGLYSTGVKCIAIVAQLIGSILWVALPRLSLLYAEKNKDGINEFSGKLYSFLITLGLPAAFGMFAVSAEVVFLVGGSDYYGASLPLKILCISFLISQFGIGFCGNFTLLPAKKEKQFMIACIITAAANIAANAFVIPLFGAAGAAATTAGGNLLALFILLPCAAKEIHISHIVRRTAGPASGSIMILLFCLIIRQFGLSFIPRLTVSVAGSILLYGIVLIVTKNETLIYGTEILKRKLKK